jgi:hypothetical protein
VKHEDDPCSYIGKVLKKFGLKTQEHKQKTRPDGTRYREYSIREIDPLSQAVYECLEERIKNQVSEFNFDWEKIVKNSSFKTAEMPANQSLQTAHLQLDNHIEARVEVCVGGHQRSGGSDSVEEVVEGSALETLEPRQNWQETIKAYAGLLADAMVCGIEVVKTLLKPWSSEERWGAFWQLESQAPEKMEQLAATVPDWYRWCDVI